MYITLPCCYFFFFYVFRNFMSLNRLKKILFSIYELKFSQKFFSSLEISCISKSYEVHLKNINFFFENQKFVASCKNKISFFFFF